MWDPKVQISDNGNELILVWNKHEEHKSRFHAQWLRFRCDCNDCHPGLVPGSFNNRIRDFSDDLRINNATVEKNNTICLKFDGEVVKNHASKFNLQWLRTNCYCDTCLNKKLEECDVISRFNNSRKDNDRTIQEIDWKDYESDKEHWVFNWMRYIFENGICIVNNAPSGEELRQMGHLLGDLAISLFVKDPESAEAEIDVLSSKDHSTSEVSSGQLTGALSLHQDFPYHPPLHATIALQMCLRFDPCIEGGDSIAVDLFEAADLLKAESPQHFKALCEIPVTFQYTQPHKGKIWSFQNTHIVVDYYEKVTSVNWNGDYSPIIQVKHKDVDRYYNAYKVFAKMLEYRKEIQYHYKHTAGKMSCFNNQRLVHSRTGFKTNGGVRTIALMCVNTVNMKSNYVALGKKLGIEVVPPKIGNGSSF